MPLLSRTKTPADRSRPRNTGTSGPALAVDANRTARCRLLATSTDTSDSGRSVTSTLPEYPSPGAAWIAEPCDPGEGPDAELTLHTHPRSQRLLGRSLLRSRILQSRKLPQRETRLGATPNWDRFRCRQLRGLDWHHLDQLSPVHFRTLWIGPRPHLQSADPTRQGRPILDRHWPV